MIDDVYNMYRHGAKTNKTAQFETVLQSFYNFRIPLHAKIWIVRGIPDLYQLPSISGPHALATELTTDQPAGNSSGA